MNNEENFQIEETEKPTAAQQDGKKARVPFKKRIVDLWHYFTTYEKIWYLAILVLAIVFAFIFPEEDTPTKVVTLDNNAFVAVEGNFNTLNFQGTTGVFVVDTVTVDGTDYAVSDFCNYVEHTVDPAHQETLTLVLPVSVTKSSQIEIECYQDSDDGNLHIAITDGGSKTLFSKEISLDDDGDGYAVSSNKFLVAAAVITFLYVLDVVLNITCELLISKQSKWNFIVSLGVEVTEIIICIVCMYRFATMATTLLFWIPCDIISFVLWHRHPDKQKEELTIVKKLKPWQDVLIIFGIAVWTVGVGYLLTLIEVEGGIFANNVTYKNIACYIDACASAVGIANGLLILFRYREQWIAWYICCILETVINIMAGQWILLVLKLGYITNTTYGYIMWTRYIRNFNKENQQKVVA